jgi:phenylacetate-CoA ligase
VKTALAVAPCGSEVETRLLAEFRRAADRVPAYRTLLDEHGITVDQVVDCESFSQFCPLLSRSNTFDRFALAQLSAGGELRDVASVLTSSGHGGRFSFGVISRTEASASAAFIDAALDAAFAVKSKPTLAINCLPMGVVLSSNCMTLATISVREDMAVALLREFGDRYEQVILFGDPLFMKRLTDYAADQAVDWRRYRINAVIGGEIFGEHFRRYIAESLGLSFDRPDQGYVMSSFGVAELGLHLGFETPATIALRRLAAAHPEWASELLGNGRGAATGLPMIFTYNPQRTFIEVVEPDHHGYGMLSISMLDADRCVPMLRYQTGDVARLLDREQVVETIGRHGLQVGEIPEALLAFKGRDREALPNGARVGSYKDALYANQSVARHFTGAVRLIFSGSSCTMHAQLVKGQSADTSLQQAVLQALPGDLRPERLVLWTYGAFPFGMGLDYERKFSNYVPGELEV